MSIVAQPVTVKPAISDPHHVREALANGPINLNVSGMIATLTFTHVRPDLNQAFDGQIKDYSGEVVPRVAMPVENLVRLKEMLNRMIQEQPPNGSLRKQ